MSGRNSVNHILNENSFMSLLWSSIEIYVCAAIQSLASKGRPRPVQPVNYVLILMRAFSKMSFLILG